MAQLSSVAPQRWLSLGAACRLLGVNEATLRQWADSGQLRVFRTPGGHRRFLREDVEALAARGAAGPGEGGGPQRWEEAMLRRIRRRLHQGGVAQQPWYAAIDEAGKDRMGLFGRRLLSLFTGVQTDRRHRADLLAEAHLVGREYGQEVRRLSLPLRAAVEAYIFFRSTLLEAAPRQAWPRLDRVLDQVLLGIASGYHPERPGVIEEGVQG